MDKMRERILELVGDYWDTAWEEAREGVSLGDRASEILEEIKAALQPPTWTPCAERLPKNTECDHGGCVWWWHQDNGEPVIAPWFSCKEEYSHWMPTGLTRPAPPEVE